MTRRKRDTVKRDLLVTLTDDERLARGATLTQLLGEQDVADEGHAAVCKMHRDAKKERLKKIRAISREVRSGKAEREVECAWVIEGTTACLIRLDTSEIIENRPATDHERQERLEGVS